MCVCKCWLSLPIYLKLINRPHKSGIVAFLCSLFLVTPVTFWVSCFSGERGRTRKEAVNIIVIIAITKATDTINYAQTVC